MAKTRRVRRACTRSLVLVRTYHIHFTLGTEEEEDACGEPGQVQRPQELCVSQGQALGVCWYIFWVSLSLRATP